MVAVDEDIREEELEVEGVEHVVLVDEDVVTVVVMGDVVVEMGEDGVVEVMEDAVVVEVEAEGGVVEGEAEEARPRKARETNTVYLNRVFFFVVLSDTWIRPKHDRSMTY